MEWLNRLQVPLLKSRNPRGACNRWADRCYAVGVKREVMLFPVLISILVTAPILALGTWLYLRRRALSPWVRVVLMLILFVFVLFSGPAIFWMWSRSGMPREFASAGSRGGRVPGQIAFLWFLGVVGVGVQFYRICRDKGEL